MLPILRLFHYTVALIYIFIYFKVKIPKTLRPAKEFFAFNVVREGCFTVNPARRLVKLPFPGLSPYNEITTNSKTVIKGFNHLVLYEKMSFKLKHIFFMLKQHMF